MDSEAVFRQAERLVRRCGTRDPLSIAKECGIWVYREPLGNLLGMYTCRLRHRMMFLNADAEGDLLRMVAAHELGHACLHGDLAAGGALKEFNLFRMKDTTEYEANAFAGHVLLPTEEVYALAGEGHDVVRMAAEMGTDINLMLIKLQEMQKLGYPLSLPYDPDSRFFRRLRSGDRAES